jgi:hypothetical protein
MPPIFRIRSILIIVFFVLLWVSALVDILKNNFKKNNKLIWIIVVVMLPCLENDESLRGVFQTLYRKDNLVDFYQNKSWRSC